jgi:hypothetical protein
MYEGKFHAMMIRLQELKRYPDINEHEIKMLENLLSTVNIESLRGDSIG